MPQMLNVGYVTNVVVTPDPANPDLGVLWITPDQGERFSVMASREALRGLWSYLTQLLYPRAADQLTGRTETVVRATGSYADDISYSATAYPSSSDPNMIVVGGFTRTTYWAITIERHTCENLWASLEDWLNQV